MTVTRPVGDGSGYGYGYGNGDGDGYGSGYETIDATTRRAKRRPCPSYRRSSPTPTSR